MGAQILVGLLFTVLDFPVDPGTQFSRQTAAYSIEGVEFHVGETIPVEGTVDQVYITKKGTYFLCFGGQFPNYTFAAIVYSRDVANFRILDSCEGKSVVVSGLVRVQKGKTQMVLERREQLHLVHHRQHDG